jgi:Flp pilus assembly protein TadD
MKMRFPFLNDSTWPAILVLALAGGLWPVGGAVSAQDNPTGSTVRDDRYLDAYMTYNEGERLEAKGQLEVALKKYREAAQVFDLLFTGYPGWEVEKLTMRRRKVNESITRVEAVLSRPPVASAPAPAAPPVAGGAAGVGAGAQPQPGSVTPAGAPAPSGPPPVGAWTGTATAGVPAELPSITEFFRQYELQWREKVDALQRKNTEMDGALKKWDEWYRWASGEIKSARTEKEGLANQIGAMDKRLQQLQRQVEAGQASQDQLDTLLKEKAALLALEKQNDQRLKVAQAAAAEAVQKVETANLQLEKIAKEREEMLKQRDAAMAERDAALKGQQEAVAKQQVMETELAEAKKGMVSEELKKVAAENERLKVALETAQKQVVALREDVTKKDSEIAALKVDLSEIRTQLGTLQKENTAYQTQVSALTAQLKELQASAAMAKTTEGGPELTEENALLMGVILRQLRMQARQQQAKALVIEELKKLEGASEALIAQVTALDTSRLSLTDAEKALFTDPQMQQLLKEGSSGSAVQATLIASGEGAEGPSTGAMTPAPTEVGTSDSTGPVITAANVLSGAQQALLEKRFDDAIQGFNEALRADPKNAKALIGVGDAYQRSGRYVDAEVALKKCLVYEPDNTTAYYLLGMTLFRDGRLNEALTAFENSLKRDEKQHLAHHYLGIIASRLKQAARAEKEFRTALAIRPDFGEAHFNLSVLYVTWEPPQLEKARSEYDSALAKGVTADENLEKLLKQ